MVVYLRLDNGGLIGNFGPNGEAKLLTPDEALAQGRLTDSDRGRLRNLLHQANSRGGPTYEPAQLGKRKDAETIDGHGDAKRSKASKGPARRATSGSRGSMDGNASQSWQAKCKSIIQKILESLGVEAQWFDRPVDEYYIPGYYSKIKTPMDLGSMKKKLESGKYKRPDDFCQDMRQVWENCITFNGKTSKYGHIGDRTSTMFEEMWAASGLDSGNSRHRRSNAGVNPIREKFDLDEPDTKTRPLRKQPSNRAVSHKSIRQEDEVDQAPMDRDQMRVLAEWMGSLEGDDLDGAINIIRDHGHGKGGSDEIELDFDALDEKTLWALDDYMEQHKKSKPGSGGRANSGFQVEPESDYESDDSDASED